MPQNWKLILTYDGSSYNGWQVQPGLPTIQGTLAQALREITGEQVLPQGSGRTDTGVHALGQVASFTLEMDIPPANLHRALNRKLPRSIRILSAELVPGDFHARHSARRKTYEYRIFLERPLLLAGQAANQPAESVDREPDTGSLPVGMPDANDRPSRRICSPFDAPYVWNYPRILNFEHMQQAAADVLGEHDFTSFAASDPSLTDRIDDDALPRSNVRTIFHSEWTRADGLLVYRVTGSGFLHHMVRNLVGTFTEIGRGHLSADTIPGILTARSRSAAGPTAPARGLFLVSVEYAEAR